MSISGRFVLYMSKRTYNNILQYVLNRRWIIVLISILISLITLSFDEYHYYSQSRHGLGIPLDFCYFIGINVPSTRLQMLLPENIIKIHFRLDIFIINIVILYIIIKFFAIKATKTTEAVNMDNRNKH